MSKRSPFSGHERRNHGHPPRGDNQVIAINQGNDPRGESDDEHSDADGEKSGLRQGGLEGFLRHAVDHGAPAEPVRGDEGGAAGRGDKPAGGGGEASVLHGEGQRRVDEAEQEDARERLHGRRAAHGCGRCLRTAAGPAANAPRLLGIQDERGDGGSIETGLIGWLVG